MKAKIRRIKVLPRLKKIPVVAKTLDSHENLYKENREKTCTRRDNLQHIERHKLNQNIEINLVRGVNSFTAGAREKIAGCRN